MKSALVVDPENITRGLLAEFILTQLNFDVVHEAGTPEDALGIFLRQRPRFVITEIFGLNFDATAFLNSVELDFETRVLVLTNTRNPFLLNKLTHLGVHGLVTKADCLAELKTAIETVLGGGRYFSSANFLFLQKMAFEYPKKESPLTPKELEVLVLIAQSQANRDISKTLEISIKTVENHRASLMRKLNIHDIAGLTRYAIAGGFIRAEA